MRSAEPSGISALILEEPLYNPAATLTMNGSTPDPGATHSAVGPLIVGNTPVSPGIHDADDLSFPDLQGTFVGSGYLTESGVHHLFPAVYAEWICSHPAVGTPAARTPGADPDDDGRSNLMEYLLRSNPTSGAGLHPLQSERKPGAWVVSYSRSKAAAAAGVISEVEYAGDLNGEWSPATPDMTRLTDEGPTETVVVTIPVPDNTATFFARLKVSMNEP